MVHGPEKGEPPAVQTPEEAGTSDYCWETRRRLGAQDTQQYPEAGRGEASGGVRCLSTWW